VSGPGVPADAPDLAVVIVNYNAGEYLGRCVASVVDAAGGVALDLLVVDNASHDGSVQAVGHAFLGPFAPGNRFTRAYRQTGWDRTTEREVDWVSFAAVLTRRSAFEEMGGFDEAFWLYGEELDLCTRLRDAGWKVLATPEVEVLHVGGVSTGRSRRTHLMHSRSVYRYYRKHRARGWRRATLPLARAALRVRAELVAARERVATRR